MSKDQYSTIKLTETIIAIYGICKSIDLAPHFCHRLAFCTHSDNGPHQNSELKGCNLASMYCINKRI